MKLFAKESVVVEKPLPLYFAEQARSDSSLYENYNLRPFNPSELYQKKGNYDIYDDMRQDEQISAVLTLKKFLILNSKWQIECEDEKVKEFLEIALYDHLDILFEKACFRILSALDYGFSLTEKVFSYEDVPGFGKKIVLSKLKTLAPHSIEFHTDEYGNISKIRQDVSTGFLDLDIKKYIHYVYQGEFQNPYGESELNVGIYRAWWSKDAIIKFWNIFLERFGMPTVVATYPKSLSSERENLKKVIKNIQSKTGIVIPEGVIMDMLGGASSGSTSEYEKAIDKYNTMIARKMLVPDLLGFSGAQTAGGSYALGKEQFDMFYHNIKHEERNLLRVLNREILNPLVAWNFGNKVYAEFTQVAVETDDRLKNINLWLEAIKTNKIPINNEQINWFYEQIEAPLIDIGELERIQEEKKEIAEEIRGGNEEENTPEEDEEKEKEVIEPEKKMALEFSREFTKYERKVNFQKIKKDTDDIEKKYVSKLAEIFKISINSLINDIRTKRIVENKRIEQINKLNLKYMNQITKIYRDMLKETFEIAIIEKSNFSIVDPSGLNDEDIAAWIQENAIFISEIDREEILNKVKSNLFEGIREGRSVADIVRMIDETLRGYDIVFEAYRIERNVRTNVSRAYNESRKQQYQDLSDEIVAYQFSAIMDGRTSRLCRSLDEKIFKPTEIDRYNPPLHFSCRSLLVPIFHDEEFTGYDSMPETVDDGSGFLILKDEYDKKIKARG